MHYKIVNLLAHQPTKQKIGISDYSRICHGIFGIRTLPPNFALSQLLSMYTKYKNVLLVVERGSNRDPFDWKQQLY